MPVLHWSTYRWLTILTWIKHNLFKRKEKPLKTVYKSPNKKAKANTNTSLNQQQIDTILDKISKSGYDTLTKTEKEFLFKQGKK